MFCIVGNLCFFSRTFSFCFNISILFLHYSCSSLIYHTLSFDILSFPCFTDCHCMVNTCCGYRSHTHSFVYTVAMVTTMGALRQNKRLTYIIQPSVFVLLFFYIASRTYINKRRELSLRSNDTSLLSGYIKDNMVTIIKMKSCIEI